MKTDSQRQSMMQRFLDGMERGGNALPHPSVIFAILTLMVILASWICAAFDVNVELVSKVGTRTVAVKSLVSADGIIYMLTHMVDNFVNFAPFGLVLVIMLGVGLSENVGLIQALLRRMVLATPKALVTPTVVFLGVMSSLAADAGYVVLIPLGALVFLGFNRHPLAGLSAAFCGVAGGFTANLFITALDPLISGMSMEAARILDPEIVVNPASNYYFMLASTVMVTIVGTIVTDKVVEPRLGEYKGNASADVSSEVVDVDEKKGLLYTGITFVITMVLMGLLVVPENAILRDPKTGGLFDLTSPFFHAFVPLIAILFFVSGLAYGIGAKTIQNSRDFATLMARTIATMAPFVVMVFMASLFISYFKYTELGTVLSVLGANGLKAMNFTGPLLMISFILLTGMLNLSISSATAKWALMAPIFVPMLMQLGYTPAMTQLAYRIGDSFTNVITPGSAYMGMIISFMQRYDEEAGLGTLLANMFPYSMALLVVWICMFLLWYVMGWPLGPGGVIHMPV